RVELVDLHAANLVRSVVDFLDEDAVPDEVVDEHPFLDRRGGALPTDVRHQVGEAVVGLGKDQVVEEDQEPGQDQRRGERGADDPEQIHAICLHGRDFVVLGEAPERGEARDENRAGERQGHHVSQGQHEQLEHHAGSDPFADGEIDEVEHEVQRQQEDDHAEPDQERVQVLAKDVPFEYSHSSFGAGRCGRLTGPQYREPGRVQANLPAPHPEAPHLLPARTPHETRGLSTIIDFPLSSHPRTGTLHDGRMFPRLRWLYILALGLLLGPWAKVQAEPYQDLPNPDRLQPVEADLSTPALPTGWRFRPIHANGDYPTGQADIDVTVDPVAGTVQESYREGDVEVREPLVLTPDEYNQILSGRT